MVKQRGDIFSDLLESEPVNDEDECDILTSKVSQFIDNQNAFAAEVRLDSLEHQSYMMKSVWNNNIHRSVSESGNMGEFEIILEKNKDDVFFGLEIDSKISSIIGSKCNGFSKKYIHLNKEKLSDVMNISIPEQNTERLYKYATENGSIYRNKESVVFECDIDINNVNWLSENYRCVSTKTESINIVLVYDLDNEQLDYVVETYQNAHQNTYVTKEFIYGVSFDISIPDQGDKNVFSLSSMPNGVDDLLGGKDLGGFNIDDIMDDSSEFDDKGFF